MQDILLEPYGAEILKLSGGPDHGAHGVLCDRHTGGLCHRRDARWDVNADPYRIAGFGALAGVFAFAAVIFSAPLSLGVCCFGSARG